MIDNNSSIDIDGSKDNLEPRPASPFSSKSSLKTTSSISSNDSLDIRMDDFFNQDASKFRPQQQISATQKPDSSANLSAAKAMNAELEKEKRELEDRLEEERIKLKEQMNLNVKRTAQQEQKLNELKQRIEDMEKQQLKLRKRESKLQQISNSIKTIEYNNIQKEIVHDFLIPKFEFNS